MRNFIRIAIGGGLLLISGSFAVPMHATSIALMDNAQYVGGSFPTKSTFMTGESVPVSITMKNTGTTTWKPGEVFFAGTHERNNHWSGGSPVFVGATPVRHIIDQEVTPGNSFTFNLNLTAPAISPSFLPDYKLQWWMVRKMTSFDQDTNFGDIVNATPQSWFVTNSKPVAPSQVRATFLGTYVNRVHPEMRIDWQDNSSNEDYFRVDYVSVDGRLTDDSWTKEERNATSTVDAYGPGIVKIRIRAVSENGTPQDNRDDVYSDPAELEFTAPAANLLPDDAMVVQNVSTTQTTFKPGERITGEVLFKNTGTNTWTRNNYFLQAVYSETQAWMGTVEQQGDIKLPKDVVSGGDVRFTINLVAPTNSVGSYKLQWRMVRLTSSGYVVFPNQTAYTSPLVWTVANPTSILDAKHVGGSFPTKTVFAPGEVVELNITMRNTGTQNWLVCHQLLLEISKANLNIGGQADGSDCLFPFAKSGEQYTFRSLVSLPTQPGTYTYQWQMASRDPGQSIDQAQRFGSVSTPWVVTVATQSINNPPVIQGITAPSVLNVREAGKWIIKAYDPEGKPLSYYVTWGDEIPQTQPAMTSSPSYEKTQTATFTHYYTTPGVYEPRFTVIDSASQKVDTSATVTVKEAVTIMPTGSIKITVTNAGIICIKEPCGVLRNAKVVVYQYFKDEDPMQFIGSSDTSTGQAAFYNLPVGKYIAYADVPGFKYNQKGFQIVSDKGQYMNLFLQPVKERETQTCPPDCPVILQPVFSNGTLIQLQRTKGVYYIENGQKRPITSRAVFDARGFDMSDVTVVDKTDFDRYPTGAPLTADVIVTPPPSSMLTEGSLVKALNDKAVYRIESGKRRPFQSGSVFEAKGYYWSDIIVVTADTLNAYPLGDVISYGHLGDGFLIKSPRSPNVYWTSNGQKQHIANESVFAAHAFRWQDIHVVSDDEIATYPVGPDMSR